MKKVRNLFNAVPDPGEVNTLPSLTIPDQAMSIQEILRRYTSGLPIGGSRSPIFDEDNDLPELSKMDLADRQTAIERYASELKDLTTKPPKPPKNDLPADRIPAEEPTPPSL